ncbi:MAG: hypothetical protein WD055_00075 [Candidatus Dependentiae bacterium]
MKKILLATCIMMTIVRADLMYDHTKGVYYSIPMKGINQKEYNRLANEIQNRMLYVIQTQGRPLTLEEERELIMCVKQYLINLNTRESQRFLQDAAKHNPLFR